MKTTTGILVLLCLAALLSGCQTSANTQRSAKVGLGGAAAGTAGYAIADMSGAADDEKALWAAGAGLAGAVITNEFLGPDQEVFREGFKQGYIEGQMDAIKRQYWMQQEVAGWTGTVGADRHEQPETEYYLMPGVTVGADGTELEEHTVAVPVMR